MKVFVRKNNVEQAIRVLRKKIQKEGVLKRVRQTRYFESPSEKRIRKKKDLQEIRQRTLSERLCRESAFLGKQAECDDSYDAG